MDILVTGGAGYIGAHAVRQLISAGHHVIVLDNLTTGLKTNIPKEATFVKGDFGDAKVLTKVFAKHNPDVVMHFAASIDLNESIAKPVEYFENNTLKTATLVQTMLRGGITKLIFSSTAAVYGKQKMMPIPESARGEGLAPYGASKLLAEQLIESYAQSAGLQAIVFRYFNACGSDFDKQIYPQHSTALIPQVVNVAAGRLPVLNIYGSKFETIDGTGVRDYVHVLDIARAHISALDVFNKQDNTTGNFKVFNIGTGTGWSVKQIVAAAERITGKTVPTRSLDARPVDVPIAVADNSKIRRELGFELKHSDLETLIKSSWQ
jgi:UDP-glucose 4-epimerase